MISGRAAYSLGIDLQIVAGEWDLARQTQQIQNFITLDMDAIVIAPVNSSGSVAILDQPTVASVRDRVAGFREALERFPNIRIVAAPAVERGLRDVAKQKTDNLLAGSRRIDAIFGSNDDCALGALASLDAAGRFDVIVVGYDATPEARTAIARGTPLLADAVQDPVEIGRRTIQAVGEYLRGGSTPSLVVVPVSLLTQDSLESR